MSSIVKHNTKTWTQYNYYRNHVYDEEYELVIRHIDKDLSQQFFVGGTNSAVVSANATKGYFQSWECYESNNDLEFTLEYLFTASGYGEYEVHLLYTSTAEGEYPVVFDIDGIEYKYNVWSSDEYLSRKVASFNLQEGTHTVKFRLDGHIRILGVGFHKVEIFKANNRLDRDAKLTLLNFTHTITKMAGADELSFVVLYDNEWKDEQIHYDNSNDSLTNFIFDFRDEVTLKCINSDGNMETIFGGYVSNCSVNSDETELTVKCAGRLIDGDVRYLVEEMTIGHASENTGFLESSIRRFDDYNHASEYLTNVFEVPLQSNLPQIIQDDTEKYHAIKIDLTTQDAVNKISSNDVTYGLNKGSLEIRNGEGTNVTQEIVLYTPDRYNTSPYCIDDYPIFYIKYGLGDPAPETSSSDGSSGSGYNKFGISADGTQIMAIGMPSSGADAKYSYTYYKSIFANKCPSCGASDLFWGWAWAGEGVCCGTFPQATDGKSHRYGYGKYKKGGIEGHVFCANCDADFSCVSGQDHWSSTSKNYLTRVSGPDSSSKEEARKLLNGGYGSTESKTTTTKKSTSDIFQTITNEAFQYEYSLGSASTLSGLLSSGSGDCWAFSELIFTRLQEAGVGCRIVQYSTNYSSQHRSVQYKNGAGEWTAFPYRQYGWGTKYNSMLNDTANQWNGTVKSSYDGKNIDKVSKVLAPSLGYDGTFDKDNPFKAWICVDYSTTASGEVHTAYLDWTAKQDDAEETYSGLVPIHLNNIFNCSEVSVVNKIKAQPSRPHVYLRGIRMQYVVGSEALYTTEDSTETTEDGSTTTSTSTDNESKFRVLIDEVGFHNETLINPVDLGSTGKTINSVLDTMLEKGELRCHMEYHDRRCDDRLVFIKSKATEPVFTAFEGDNGNIIDISSWDYNPTSDYFNRSLVVYKKSKGDSGDSEDTESIYNYVESRNPEDIIKYGELSNVVSMSEDISTQEAYYNARQNLTTNTNLTGSSMTITVIGHPANVNLNDYMACVFENNKYNDDKKVMSITTSYNVTQIPKLQSKYGLNRVAPELEIKEQFEQERVATKQKTAVFGKTAMYSHDDSFKMED